MDPAKSAAYGGDNWQARVQTHEQELTSVWQQCGIDSEWRKLRSVLLHRPGEELMLTAEESDRNLLLEPLDLGKARDEHDQLAQTYADAGVAVHRLESKAEALPNQMFCADTFAMTPQGAVLARPASIARAGEERLIAARLADLGIPILKTLVGNAVFEGADLMWLDESTAMIGRGHRTNQAAIDQIGGLFAELGYDLIAVDLPFGTMHFMGMLRIPRRDLAIGWSTRTPYGTVMALRERGFQVAFLPDMQGRDGYRAMNFVTLDDGRILMVSGLDEARQFYESLGVECLTSPTDELSKAAGNIGCLTGVIWRDKGPLNPRTETAP